jgi:hypothetical protein
LPRQVVKGRSYPLTMLDYGTIYSKSLLGKSHAYS